MRDQPMTIRFATTHDAWALRRLAALDSASALTGRVLVAEREGAPIAAVSLESGAAIADPFQPTAGAPALLRLRRYEILRRGGAGALAWAALRRAVSIAAP